MELRSNPFELLFNNSENKHKDPIAIISVENTEKFIEKTIIYRIVLILIDILIRS